MSTNFYVKWPQFDNRNEVHIGKRSAGWAFTFNSIYGNVRSWEDWKYALESVPCVIRDEYGDMYSVDEFIKVVEATISGEVIYPDAQDYKRGRAWMDPHGWRFNNYDFI